MTKMGSTQRKRLATIEKPSGGTGQFSTLGAEINCRVYHPARGRRGSLPEGLGWALRQASTIGRGEHSHSLDGGVDSSCQAELAPEKQEQTGQKQDQKTGSGTQAQGTVAPAEQGRLLRAPEDLRPLMLVGLGYLSWPSVPSASALGPR